MLHGVRKTRQRNFKKLSSTYYPLCNLRQHWKGLSLGKNHESLAFSQVGRWKHSRSTTSASLSHRHNSSTESVLPSYAKFSQASKTMLSRACVVLVFCIYFGSSSLATRQNTRCSQATKLQVWNVAAQHALLMGAAQDGTTVCSANLSHQRLPEGEVCKWSH